MESSNKPRVYLLGDAMSLMVRTGFPEVAYLIDSKTGARTIIKVRILDVGSEQIINNIGGGNLDYASSIALVTPTKVTLASGDKMSISYNGIMYRLQSVSIQLHPPKMRGLVKPLTYAEYILIGGA